MSKELQKALLENDNVEAMQLIKANIYESLAQNEDYKKFQDEIDDYAKKFDLNEANQSSIRKWLRKNNAENKPKGFIISDASKEQLADFNKNNDAGNFSDDKSVKEVIFKIGKDTKIVKVK